MTGLRLTETSQPENNANEEKEMAKELEDKAKQTIEKAGKNQSTTEFERLKLEQLKKLDADLRRFKIPIVLLERLKKEFDDSHYLSNEIGKSVIMPSFK